MGIAEDTFWWQSVRFIGILKRCAQGKSLVVHNVTRPFTDQFSR
jgi:hypothetical protein